MRSAQSVANYFLAKTKVEEGDLITNLKLQKLLYYAQGYHLAMFDAQALFVEAIEAWNHGPVVPTIYHHYKTYGGSGLPFPEDFDPEQYSEKLQDFLDEIYQVFAQFSAWKLREMTHEEAPWKEAFERNRGVISHESMKNFFKNHLLQ